MKILIVDDDPKLRGFLRQGLDEQNLQCAEASSVAEAREQLRNSFDLILLDVMLPDGEGWQVLRELRESICVG